MKKHIKVGDKIKLHYEGSFEDGSVFDSSIDREPLTVTAGNGEVIKGFDDALIGMEVKQKKKVNINSDNAYGPIQKELIVEIARNKLPKDMNLDIGQQLQIPIEDGNNIVVTIKEISNEKILLDGNHPLAGRNLIFNIEIIDVE